MLNTESEPGCKSNTELSERLETLGIMGAQPRESQETP